jgi:hypothetical protein
VLEALLGLVGGVLVGATGSGFGVLITPLLFSMGYSWPVAVGTTLGVLVATKFAGAVTHHQLGHLPKRNMWLLLAGGLTGTLAAGIAAVSLFHVAAASWSTASAEGDPWLTRLVGVLLLGIGGFALVQGFWKTTGDAAAVSAIPVLPGAGADDSLPVIAPRDLRHRMRRAALFAAGLGTGAGMTLTSAGSGSVLVPVLALVTDWAPSQLAAASNVFGVVVGGFGVLLFSHAGQFSWPLFAKVLIGTLPGLYAGAILSRHIKRSWLLCGLGTVALVIGVHLLFK